MSEFPLRPVSHSRSPSPQIMPPLIHSPSSNIGPPRPWSPSHLSDVDLSRNAEGGMSMRRYPAPPTGHDLMALFPPQPPATVKEPAAGMPTSGWFERQERAFFAKAGNEIVRVRKDEDGGHNGGMDKARSSGDARGVAAKSGSQPWQLTSPQMLLHPASMPPHAPHAANSRPGEPSVPISSRAHPHGQVMVANLHESPMQQHISPAMSAAQRTPTLRDPHPHPHAPPHPSAAAAAAAAAPKPEPQQEDWRDDPDEAWRRPMPYAERRRAGKHTKRVIVRT